MHQEHPSYHNDTKETVKQDNLASWKDNVLNTSSTKIRCNDHAHTKHHKNENGDVISYYKHNHKKHDACTTKTKTLANGGTIFAGDHSKMCTIEVTNTSTNVLDCKNLMIDTVDEYSINRPELTPNQIWSHVK